MSHQFIYTKTVCSKCASESWEGFTRQYGVSGVRCLACGHTKYNPSPFEQQSASSSWQQQLADPVNKF